MVEAIVHNKNRLLPCISLLQGEYGKNDLAIGVPVVLNENGMDRIVELDLTKEEQQAFDQSAQVVTELTDEIKTLL